MQTYHERVLVIGSEVLTSIANPADRNTLPLFGDGAGAVILELRRSNRGFLDEPFVVDADPEGVDCITVPAGGSALPAHTPDLNRGLCYLQMNGPEVYRLATRIIVEVIQRLCRLNQLTPDAIDFLVPHQANWRILETAARLLCFPIERVADTVRVCGNTSAASIPISLAIAVEQGRLKPGMLVALCAFGAGLTWGGALLRWDTA